MISIYSSIYSSIVIVIALVIITIQQNLFKSDQKWSILRVKAVIFIISYSEATFPASFF